MATPIRLNDEQAEVALAETQAVLALVQDTERRGRLGALVAAIQERELDEGDAQALEEIVALGLSTGRIRGVYGPEGEQAALKLYRKLPGGKEISASAREVSEALSSLAGQPLDTVSIQPAGPGAWIVTIGVEGRELSVRLDGSGARIHSVGI